jgi:hypothetical protein
MLTEDAVLDPVVAKSALRSTITSYDTGYEHSLEHLIELQRMVDEADEVPHVPAWLHALGIEY